jgi:hypothetical protein
MMYEHRHHLVQEAKIYSFPEARRKIAQQGVPLMAEETIAPSTSDHAHAEPGHP